jgi:hypothetical protein
MPLAVVIVLAVIAAGVAVVARREPEPAPYARPTPVVTTKTQKPAPTKAPPKKPKPKKTPAPAPQPVRTYSPPKGGIPVRGRIVDAAGRPVAGAKVGMERHEGLLEGLFKGLTMVFSLGLVCLSDFCEIPYGVGRTDANGDYTVYLEHDVDDYDVTVEHGDVRFWTRVDFNGKPLRLTTITWWDPAPVVGQDGSRVRVRFRAPPSSLGSWDSASGSVETAKGYVLLSLADLDSGDTFDGRLAEDAAAKVAVTLNVRAKIGEATYTGTTPYGARFRPASRGKTCTEYGASGRAYRRSPCPLTNGDLTTEWTPKVATYKCPKDDYDCLRKVTVDLGSARQVRLVAVRGCDVFETHVQVSTDGKRWTDLTEAGPDTGDSRFCTRTADHTARYVRVKLRNVSYGGLSEISVF